MYQDHLPGPMALTLSVPLDAYEDEFAYNGVLLQDSETEVTTAGIVAFTQATVGEQGYFYQIDWDAEFLAADDYSDIFLEYRCGQATAGTITWDASWKALPESADDGASLGAGLRIRTSNTVAFGTTDVCNGEYFSLRAEIVSAFNSVDMANPVRPSLTSLKVYADMDADEDTFTVGGLYNAADGTITTVVQQDRQDCDDADNGNTVNTWFKDFDVDGYPDDSDTGTFQCANPGTGAAGDNYIAARGDSKTDCVDDPVADPTDLYHEDATEAVNGGIDYNCDQVVTCSADADTDGYGHASTTTNVTVDAKGDTESCLQTLAEWTVSVASPPANSTSNITTDCDDNDPDEFPGVQWYTDADGDTFGLTPTTLCERTSPSDVTDNTDCKDSGTNAILFKPTGAVETDGVGEDRDCGGTIECYVDVDEDGQGTDVGTTVTVTVDAAGGEPGCDHTELEWDSQAATDPNTGTSSVATDCNDGASTAFVGGTEVCDALNVDEDCDGGADDDDPEGDATGTVAFYPDSDADTFGDSAGTSYTSCDPVECFTELGDAVARWSGESLLSDNDGATTTYDCVANNGAVTFATGKVGQGMVFDGSSDLYCGTDSNLISSDSTTIEMWMKIGSGADDDSTLVARNDSGGGKGFTLQVRQKKKLRVDQGSSADDGVNDSIVAGTWHHVAYVRDGTSGYFYIDGALSSTETISASDFGDVGENFTIGSDDNNGDFFTGMIDEVAFHAAQLTLEEIREIYLAGSAGVCGGPSTAGVDVADNTDCNDDVASVNTDATEVCDGYDTDCAGSGLDFTDETDGDSDTWLDCDSSAVPAAEFNSTDYSQGVADCDPVDPDVNGGTQWYVDVDGDGYGDEDDTATNQCSNPGSEVTNNTDCDDSTNTVNPGITTEADGSGVDIDCDDRLTCFLDEDGDEDGDDGGATVIVVLPAGVQSLGGSACTATATQLSGAGFSTDPASDLTDLLATDPVGGVAGIQTDCDDGDETEFGTVIWYNDGDGDGLGDPADTNACERGAGAASAWVTDNTDCDDTTNTIGADVTWYVDADEDGVPAIGAASTVSCTSPGIAWTETAPVVGSVFDCKDDPLDDPSDQYNTSIDEEDGVGTDFDCDGIITCFVDGDGDGDGDTTATLQLDLSATTSNPNAGAVYGCDHTAANLIADNAAAVTGALSNVSSTATDCKDDDVTYSEVGSNPAPTAEVDGVGIDYNCDLAVVCFTDGDNDNDGSGTATVAIDESDGDWTAATRTYDCGAAGNNYAATETDCKDANPLFFGDAVETIGVGIDYNCDGMATCYLDDDEDGDGSANTGTVILPVVTDEAAIDLTVDLGGTRECDRTAAGVVVKPVLLTDDTVDDDILSDAELDVVEDDSRDDAGSTSSNADDCRDGSVEGDATGVYNLNGTSTAETPAVGLDYNCDGAVACYADVDGDGDGDDTPATALVSIAVDLGGDPGGTVSPCRRLAADDLAGLTVVGGDDAPNTSNNKLDCDDDSTAYNFNSHYVGLEHTAETAVLAADFSCDGVITCFADDDGDGDGDPAATVDIDVNKGASLASCTRLDADDALETPAGDQAGNTSANSADCDDDDANYNTNDGGVDDIVTGEDKDCDGKLTCFADVDGDGDGDSDSITVEISALDTDGLPVTCDRLDTDNATLFSDPSSGAPNTSSNVDDCNDADTEFNINGTGLLAPTEELPGVAIDYNCDRDIVCYHDLDDDGQGDESVGVESYRLVENAVTNPGDTGDCGGTADDLLLYADGVDDLGDPEFDCDDGNDDIYVGAPEVTGGEVDNNCSGSLFCYADLDLDTFGSTSSTVEITEASPGGATIVPGDTYTGACLLHSHSTNNTDCNDNALLGAAYNTSIVEVDGAGFDYNCDSSVTCYKDLDKDGYGDADVDGGGSNTTPVALDNAGDGDSGTCDSPSTSVADDHSDCNDDPTIDGALFGLSTAQAFIDAEAAAIGEGRDFNCDGSVECYIDFDGDGYGGASNGDGLNKSTDVVTSLTLGTDGAQPGTANPCLGSGWADNADDCRDCTTIVLGDPDTCSDDGTTQLANAAVNPGALQVEVFGNSLDENCDNEIACYLDVDGDLQGDQATDLGDASTWGGAAVVSNGEGDCDVAGTSSNDDDCHDDDELAYLGATVHFDVVLGTREAGPGANTVELTEIPGNDLDDDCDGEVLCFLDADLDGYGIDFDGVGSAPQDASLNWTGFTEALWKGEATITDPNVEGGYTSWRTNLGFQTWAGCDENVTTCGTDTDGDDDTGDRVRAKGGRYVCETSRAEASLTYDNLGLRFDCVDSDYDINPGAEESTGQIGTSVDWNCDGEVECFVDLDNDGVGGSGQAWDLLRAIKAEETGTGSSDDYLANGYDARDGSNPSVCKAANDFAIVNGDCHDNNPDAYALVPGGPTVEPTEIVGDGYDNNCDNYYACYRDLDGDLYGTDTVFIEYDPDQTEPSTLVFYCDKGGATGATVSSTSWTSSKGGSPGSEYYDCHPNDADGHPNGRSGETVSQSTGDVSFVSLVDATSEVTGNGLDDDCDTNIACYLDADQDEYGVDVDTFLTASYVATDTVDFTVPSSTTAGVFTFETIALTGVDIDAIGGDSSDDTEHSRTWDCAPQASMAEARARVGSTTELDFDCHDNYQYANPGINTEVKGHTTANGGTDPTLGVVVGTGAGQTDLCGTGGADCYGVAFDEDCDGLNACYVDADDDGYGSYLIEEPGILSGQHDPHADPAIIDPQVGTLTYDPSSDTFTCDTSQVGLIDATNRSSVGGVAFGEADYDCNDGNAFVLPTSGGATELPGHTENPNDTSQSYAFDEDCDGKLYCFEDLDEDGFGTRVVDISNTSSQILAETATIDVETLATNTVDPGSATITYRRYDCRYRGTAGSTDRVARTGIGDGLRARVCAAG